MMQQLFQEETVRLFLNLGYIEYICSAECQKMALGHEEHLSGGTAWKASDNILKAAEAMEDVRLIFSYQPLEWRMF